MNKIFQLAVSFTVFFLIALPVLSFAGGPGFGGGVNDGGAAACPLDGGLSMLVAAGIGYGAKKIMGKKKQTATQDK